MAVSFSLSLLALVPSIYAQNSGVLCSWPGVRAGVVQDSLYLEGGLRYVGSSWSSSSNRYMDCATVQNDERLFKLNFSKSFDVSNNNFLDLFDLVDEKVDANAPVYYDGGLFADNDELYTVGGMASPQHKDSIIETGAISAKLFQPNSAATGFVPSVQPYYNLPSTVTTPYIASGAGVSVPSEHLGFYFSGVTTSNASLPLDYQGGAYNTSYQPAKLVTTMLKVDTSSDVAVWTEMQIDSSITLRAGATMAWIPVGSQGALVVIGGNTYPADVYGFTSLTTTQIQANSANGPTFISSVPVYDIANNKWYTVNTTGPFPNPIVGGCAVVATANDGSSHQIHVYGGYDGSGRPTSDGSSNPPSDAVWILSVPSFTWIQASAGTSSHGRFGHVCAKPYPDQMIAVGGASFRGNPLTTQSVVDNFDLNNLTWTGKYDPSQHANYTVPSVVTQVIGGNGGGSATATAAGIDSGLSALFGTRYTKTIQTFYPYAPASTPSAAPAAKKSVAVPVAVSVVVVVVVLVTAIIAWFCLFSPAARRRRSEKASDDSTRASNNNFISRWVTHSAQFPPPPKSIISSDATEIGESLSPRAEVAGFSYFTPHARPSGPSEVDGQPLYGQSKTGTPIQRATSPGSPGSHGSAELDGIPTPPPGMSEILNNQRNTEVYRSHPLYPASIGGLSQGSGLARYANARLPSETASDAVELPQNRSNEHLGLAPPQTDLNRSKSDKSHTETSTDISAATDSDMDLRNTSNPISSGVRTPDLIPHQSRATTETSSKPQGGKSYPPTALSNIASQSKTPHHRSTSSASSGMAVTLSPTNSEAYATVSPGEEQRRSNHLSLLPDHLPRNVVADAEKDNAATTTGKKEDDNKL